MCVINYFFRIKFNKDVLPACLNTGGPNELYATATGWGTLGHRQSLADVLQVVCIKCWILGLLKKDFRLCFNVWKLPRAITRFFFVYDNAKITLLCLMESLNRVQEWWSYYALRIQTMQHVDPNHGGLVMRLHLWACVRIGPTINNHMACHCASRDRDQLLLQYWGQF